MILIVSVAPITSTQPACFTACVSFRKLRLAVSVERIERNGDRNTRIPLQLKGGLPNPKLAGVPPIYIADAESSTPLASTNPAGFTTNPRDVLQRFVQS